MKRREALKNTGLLLAFFGSSSALTLLQACKSEPKDSWKPVFIESEQLKAVSALIDTFLPGNSTFPSGTSVGMHRFMDSFVQDTMKDAVKQKIKTSLTDFFASFMNKTSTKFEDADFDTRAAFVQEQLIKEQQSQDKTAFPLLNQLKGLLAFGYTTAEKVSKEVLVYDPVPGPYQGKIPLSDTNGRLYAAI